MVRKQICTSQMDLQQRSIYCDKNTKEKARQIAFMVCLSTENSLKENTLQRHKKAETAIKIDTSAIKASDLPAKRHMRGANFMQKV